MQMLSLKSCPAGWMAKQESRYSLTTPEFDGVGNGNRWRLEREVGLEFIIRSTRRLFNVLKRLNSRWY